MRSQKSDFRMQHPGIRASLLAVLLVLVVAPPATYARDRAIIATGGDPNPEIAAWRKGLADKFESEFKRRSGDTSDVSRPEDPAGVESAIKGLKGKVKCGEDIVIYFNGHGTASGRLCFYVRHGNRVSEQSVSPADVLKWLTEAALPCCCRIHLVIHACYSGEFIEKVALGEIHVVTAVSSATDTRPAHKDVRGTVLGGVVFDGNDWPTGLNEDLDSVPPPIDWQPALQTAKKSAKKKMRDKWEDKDKPQTWKRFKNYHVEEVTIDPKTKRKTVKLRSADGTEHTVVMGPGSKVKVGDQELEYCVLNVCSWVTVLVHESDAGVYEVRQCLASLNISGASGHVQGRNGDTFSMHFDSPPHLKCQTRDVRPAPGKTLPEGIRYCKWVVLDSAYQDSTGITVGGVTETDPPAIEIRGHVQSVNPETGEMEVHIWYPTWLRCNTRKVTLAPGEHLPGWVKKCKWVKLTGKLTGSITDATGITQTDPEVLTYQGHVREVKDGRATVHIQKPDWLLCEVKVLQPPRGTELPAWVKPCTTITFKGPLTGDTIRLGSFGMGRVVIGSSPVDIGFTAHVESVGPGYIVVTIREPERMAGQQRRMKMKPGEKIPEGVEFCKTISFVGNIIFDSIINGRSIRLTSTPGRSDAGVHHVLAPGGEVPAYTRTTPAAEVHNYGTEKIAVLPVSCLVESAGVSVYEDSATASELVAGATAAVRFREWQAAGPGAAYDVVFTSRLAGDENPTNDAVTLPVTVTAAENQAPSLTDGKVEPGYGLPTTVFRFAVNYTDPDGDMPVVHEVILDGAPFTMASPGGNPVEGMPFLQELPGLGPGRHSYRFRFDDGHGHQVETKEQTGPMVEEGENHAPVLSEWFVEPPVGNTLTPFVYGVTYQDEDGDPPAESEVIIDGEPFPMDPQGGDPVRGMPFLHEVPGLKPGRHTYGFRFTDSRGMPVLIEAQIGPTVEE